MSPIALILVAVNGPPAFKPLFADHMVPVGVGTMPRGRIDFAIVVGMKARAPMAFKLSEAERRGSDRGAENEDVFHHLP